MVGHSNRLTITQDGKGTGVGPGRAGVVARRTRSGIQRGRGGPLSLHLKVVTELGQTVEVETFPMPCSGG